MSPQRPKVIIVGAGFGGLFAAKTLANKPVDVLLVDKHNYHTFTPLLYQVATSALDPSEIAYPVRSIFRKHTNVRVLLAELTAVDLQKREVLLHSGEGERWESYDYLHLAAGSVPTFFGREDIHRQAFELRTLPDTIKLRNHLLKRFEEASWVADPERRASLTTIVVVGGGPTGLETAGAIHELFNDVLNKEFAQNDIRARVVLVEARPHLLTAYPAGLRQAALEQLQSLGVEVSLNNPLAEVTPHSVLLADGTQIPSSTLVWSAGVMASPVAGMLDRPLESGGRIPIDASMRVVGEERIFAVGDMTYLEDSHGEAYPMLIPVAQQQGILAAQNILAHMEGQPLKGFVYHDRGVMATIGRSRAVAWLYNRIPLRGFLAWLVWLVFHLYTLIGFRNRLNVLVNWTWNYFTYDRSVRIILEQSETD